VALIADKLGDDFVYYIKGKDEGFATIREKIVPDEPQSKNLLSTVRRAAKGLFFST
jgi:hypothetical protein